MKISAIIQARMTSQRLPGKVMADICSKPMIWHIVDRLRHSKKIDEIILAIPDIKESDGLEEFAKSHKIKYFRGSENDVLSRYYGAAKKFACDVIIRITGDCPLIDPQIIDLIIEKHLGSKADYTSNCQQRTFPRGLDAEVFNFDVLKRVFESAKADDEKEHVTLYIEKHAKNFKLASVAGEKNLSHLRLTVDEKKDIDFVREIYENLYREDKIFLLDEILELLKKRPDLTAINENIRQKEL